MQLHRGINMVKLRDLVKDALTDEEKAKMLPHPSEKTVMTEALADQVGAPKIVKDKVKGT